MSFNKDDDSPRWLTGGKGDRIEGGEMRRRRGAAGRERQQWMLTALYASRGGVQSANGVTGWCKQCNCA